MLPTLFELYFVKDHTGIRENRFQMLHVNYVGSN